MGSYIPAVSRPVLALARSTGGSPLTQIKPATHSTIASINMEAHKATLGVRVGSVGSEQVGDGGGLGAVQRGDAQWTPAVTRWHWESRTQKKSIGTGTSTGTVPRL